MLSGNEPMPTAQGTARLDEFEQAALPHRRDLFRTASRLLGDRERAEDVLQEVYLQAWKSYDRFEAGTNIRAWLYKILFNSVHHYRRKWFNSRVIKDGEELLETVVAAPAPVAESLTDKDILAALDRIPIEYKGVILLADVEEFSYKEISQVLEIPMGTVMSRLSRARRLLREQLVEVAASYGIGRTMQKELGA
jgi:RNA polymerase sigma-70 factor (ECF subfamily)